LGVKGEKDFFGDKRVSVCVTCDDAFYKGEGIAVIGDGDTTCEEDPFLTNFRTEISLICSRDLLKASKLM
jgi:thioredoxin reductase (NADPH)